jgi:hypothetical protein
MITRIHSAAATAGYWDVADDGDKPGTSQYGGKPAAARAAQGAHTAGPNSTGWVSAMRVIASVACAFPMG